MHLPQLILFARPKVSLTVKDATEEFEKAYTISQEEASRILSCISRVCSVATFPYTYRLEVHDGVLTSTLVSTYGEESTLRLIRELRESDPGSFK